MIILPAGTLFTTVEEILYRVRRETGLLHDIKLSNGTALVTCPYHHNGYENKPSCIINLVENNTYQVGSYHCFSCKENGSLAKLVGACYNKNEIWGMKWLLDNYLAAEENRSGLFNVPSRIKPAVNDFTCNLDELRYTHQYMYHRYLTDDIIKKYDVGYKDGFITFPIRDNKGKLLFIAKRSVIEKTFILPKHLDKPIVYEYECYKYFPDSKEVFIVESIFNALTLAKWGKPAITLLGVGSNNQIEALSKLPYRRLILALDNDKAGKVGMTRIKSKIKDKLISQIEIAEENMDINDYGYLNSWGEFEKCLRH